MTSQKYIVIIIIIVVIVLQDGRSRVRMPMRWIILINLLNLPSPIRSLVLLSLYQKQKNNVSGEERRGRCMRLTTSPPSVSRMSRQCGILSISQPYRLPRSVTWIALLSYTYMIFVPHKKHSYGPPHSVMGRALLLFLSLYYCYYYYFIFCIFVRFCFSIFL
jgi:hypothetical protein